MEWNVIEISDHTLKKYNKISMLKTEHLGMYLLLSHF